MSLRLVSQRVVRLTQRSVATLTQCSPLHPLSASTTTFLPSRADSKWSVGGPKGSFQPVASGYRVFEKKRDPSLPELSLDEVTQRVLKVIRVCDRLPTQYKTGEIGVDSKFTELGLDSLDVVDIQMAMELEFQIDIPDIDIEKIFSPRDYVEFFVRAFEVDDMTEEEKIASDHKWFQRRH